MVKEEKVVLIALPVEDAELFKQLPMSDNGNKQLITM